ncbi:MULTISPECIES: glycerate kinase [Lacticaseibacillus]|uniref:Glycerate kinase n=2 Tax=Lacticaseibacillus TaxID=2759736 RepID=A0AAN1C6L4_LACCA|nr:MULTISPECIES: glycerate kinase [Lacticaseibacillus]ARY90549.1 hypothetical protein BGL52_01740 [Lacticaseibacillus casei]KAB1970407.1 glycerate kinase [Lacticaseibacillus casei]WLV81167.1 glycerate kinase [Lacticaseibacillus sp. NCIMB 15473]WNX25127.1 glycerate kinase [Lacticaseibacillus casei]WNX27898.1 glycerate kinase [Lacticaseibacillus casei]
MKALVAIDSFKGSFTSSEAAKVVAKAFEEQKILCDRVVVADGGEGTTEALLKAYPSGVLKKTYVHSPSGNEIRAQYGWINTSKTAIIEAAEASGLKFVEHNGQYLNPLKTSSFGTGELIRQAICHGARHVIVGLGGSGTNDAGMGCLEALGFQFFDRRGVTLQGNAENLAKIVRIDSKQTILQRVEVTACTDVRCPLTGSNGATYIFGMQKGVRRDQLASLDQSIAHFARLMDPKEKGMIAGDGAAGGLGFALRVAGATLTSGLAFVAKQVQLEKRIANVDIVITGEGSLDQQSLKGKAPIQIAQIAKTYRKPCIAFVGQQKIPLKIAQVAGLSSVFPIVDHTMDLHSAMIDGLANLQHTGERVAALIHALDSD